MRGPGGARGGVASGAGLRGALRCAGRAAGARAARAARRAGREEEQRGERGEARGEREEEEQSAAGGERKQRERARPFWKGGQRPDLRRRARRRDLWHRARRGDLWRRPYFFFFATQAATLAWPRELDAVVHGVEPWNLDAMKHGVDTLGPNLRLRFPGVQKGIFFKKKGQIVKNWGTWDSQIGGPPGYIIFCLSEPPQ